MATKNLEILKAGQIVAQALPGAPAKGSTFLKLNVCGQKFQLRRETALKYPSSRLGKVALGKRNSLITGAETSCVDIYDFYDNIHQEYYFERDPSVFPLILTFYIEGILHIPRHVCIDHFQAEVEYWGLPFNLDCCCQGFHQQEWEITETVKKTNELFDVKIKSRRNEDVENMGSEINLNPTSHWKKLKRKTWDLFENQDTSLAASAISFISSFMVIISTITLCVNTHPDVMTTRSDGTKVGNPILTTIETVCIVWFTIEYNARIISCPNKKLFLKSVLNTIDLLSILPYFVGLLLETTNDDISNNLTAVRRFVQILRIFRIVRIFKFARHSTGLQVLGYTVRNSGSELGLLFMLLLMGMTLFSCLIYYAEESVHNTKFESIIAAFWWSLITMTTVGYGDMYPETSLGKVIGSLCCVSGILFIALPIPTIVSNFSAFYKDHLNKEKLSKLYDMQLSEEEDNVLGSDILVSESETSIYQNTLPLKRLSLAQIEKHEIYRRRMSTLSGKFSKVHPVINENC